MANNNKDYISQKMLYARLDDILDYSAKGKGVGFFGFLDEKEIMLVRSYFKKEKVSGYKFYGGYDNAVRNYVAVWNGDDEPCGDDFSICGLTFRYASENKLSHRDFLGCLLGTGISKESIGDILVGDGLCVVFLKDKIAGFVENEINMVGSTRVSVKREIPLVLPAAFSLSPVEVLISSNRLDCIVSAVTRVSRSEAVSYINNAYASVNFTPCLKITKQLDKGDILSLRGFGRYIFESEIGRTKKDRIKILLNKYV